MSEVQGTAADGFGAVTDLLAANLADGTDVGASLCVIRDGEIVVDLWGGVADVESGRAWERDTIVHTWSVTKTMATLVVMHLVDQGVLDLRAPVATYWPEFAANGKELITVEQILAHTAGVPGWDEPMDVDAVCDVPAASAKLAEQAPWWTPGEGSGYAALAFGHLLSELVLRASGRTLSEVFRTEVAGPIGADYHIGTTAEVEPRIATLIAPEGRVADMSKLGADHPAVRVLGNPVMRVPATATEQWRRAELAGVNGHGNARSMAQLQSALSHQGIAHGGHRLLSEEAVREIHTERAHGPDRVLFLPIRFGLGVGLSAPDAPGWLPENASWWPGWGGAIVVNDIDRRVTMAYAMNKMTVDLVGAQRTTDYVRTVWEALG
ncbi:serine hydrolase domain-containing protein [Enemella sp. A6]|uniref:serine hydrolase domain-containing protein n=1 Tax=Enemella sp. A6 TaxID=3440152 RepID=UPI003EC0C5DC